MRHSSPHLYTIVWISSKQINKYDLFRIKYVASRNSGKRTKRKRQSQRTLPTDISGNGYDAILDGQAVAGSIGKVGGHSSSTE